MTPTLPVFSIERHRLVTDGQGVTTLVGAYGCPLQCRYCINPHAWDPSTLDKCVRLTPEQLYDKVKIDNLYFLATGGGVTFGGGESLLHAPFIAAFRQVCGPGWHLAVETSLHVPCRNLEQVLDAVDEFIVDIKDMDGAVYESYTGQPQAPLEENLRRLAASGGVCAFGAGTDPHSPHTVLQYRGAYPGVFGQSETAGIYPAGSV